MKTIYYDLIDHDFYNESVSLCEHCSMRTRKYATNKELFHLLKNRFEFYQSWHQNKHLGYQFIQYCSNSFNRKIPKCKKKKNYLLWKSKLNEYLTNQSSDYNIIRSMRSLADKPEDLLKDENNYHFIMQYKINQLQHSIGEHISKDKINSLDIGTENLEFLQMMEKKFNANAYGLNIKSGFNHYNDEFFNYDKKNPQFKFYNGTNIPYKDNTFDLVSCISVIHHIPDDDWKKLAKDICRVLKKGGLFVFKDVDIKHDYERTWFRYQHYLWEGLIVPGLFSYMNDTCTFDKTTSPLNLNMKLIKCFKFNNFNGTYIAVYQKK